MSGCWFAGCKEDACMPTMYVERAPRTMGRVLTNFGGTLSAVSIKWLLE